jgi:hypothetical protein
MLRLVEPLLSRYCMVKMQKCFIYICIHILDVQQSRGFVWGVQHDLKELRFGDFVGVGQWEG